MNTNAVSVELKTETGKFIGTIEHTDGWLILRVPFLGVFRIEPESAREFCNDVLSCLIMGNIPAPKKKNG